MAFPVKPLPYLPDALEVISSKTLEIHHGKLYAGYVNFRNEIEEKLKAVDKEKINANYSEFRELKLEEGFVADAQILHELYFQTMGPKERQDQPSGELLKQLEQDFGSFEAFMADIKACGMAARGWAVAAFDPSDGKVRNFLLDFHSHGGIWTTTPILVLDVYEHAYFLDYGSDKKSYIEAWSKIINWDEVEKLFA